MSDSTHDAPIFRISNFHDFNFSTIPNDVDGLESFLDHLLTRNNSGKTKCYSARTGLRRSEDFNITMDCKYQYCKHCLWYSYVFYHKRDRSGTKIIENEYDFEQVKKQFVNHMNRSHPNIVKKKLQKKLDNPKKYT